MAKLPLIVKPLFSHTDIPLLVITSVILVYRINKMLKFQNACF